MNIRCFAATVGGVLGAVAVPAFPYAAVCTLMVMADVVTAWMLSRRIAARYGTKVSPETGKFQSRRFGKVAVTLLKIYGLLFVASALDAVLLTGDALRFSAGAVCFWQAVSVIENEASCSNARWARMARRYLADKARRYLS